jgi:hypothetical protein
MQKSSGHTHDLSGKWLMLHFQPHVIGAGRQADHANRKSTHSTTRAWKNILSEALGPGGACHQHTQRWCANPSLISIVHASSNRFFQTETTTNLANNSIDATQPMKKPSSIDM